MAESTTTDDDPIAAEQWKQREQWDKLEVLRQPGVPAAPGQGTARDSQAYWRRTSR